MIPSDALSLIAELSLGLLGFAGVAAAFGGQERAFSEADRLRLLGLFCNSAIPLFGCLSVYVMSAASLEGGVTYTLAGLLSLAIHLRSSVLTMPGVSQSARDAEATTEGWTLRAVWGQVIACLVLYLVEIVAGGVAWPLLAAYSSHLAIGVFLFWGISRVVDKAPSAPRCRSAA